MEPQAPLPPLQQPPPRPQGNGMGLAGFIVSLVGIVTCGVVSPIGLILSAIGLRRQPRGLAIAGTVISVLGVLVLAVGAVLLLSGGGMIGGVVKTGFKLPFAIQRIEEYKQREGEYPDEAKGNELLSKFEDGWGHPFRYSLTELGFEIRSAGPDGEFGTRDDIPSSR